MSQGSAAKRTRTAWDTTEVAFEDVVTLEQLVLRTPFRKSKDEHGHSITAAARVPESVERKVVELREMTGSPYQLNSDVVRDAIYLGLQILHIRYKKAEEWAVIRELADISGALSEAQRTKDSVRDLIADLSSMMEEGDPEKAAEYLTRYTFAASGLNDPWRKEKIISTLRSSSVVTSLLRHCPPEMKEILG